MANRAWKIVADVYADAKRRHTAATPHMIEKAPVAHGGIHPVVIREAMNEPLRRIRMAAAENRRKRYMGLARTPNKGAIARAKDKVQMLLARYGDESAYRRSKSDGGTMAFAAGLLLGRLLMRKASRGQ